MFTFRGEIYVGAKEFLQIRDGDQDDADGTKGKANGLADAGNDESKSDLTRILFIHDEPLLDPEQWHEDPREVFEEWNVIGVLP